tara:strand:- start:14 stop:124 length:111 start_codon:yes stop_codon:yes gene_type:complete
MDDPNAVDSASRFKEYPLPKIKDLLIDSRDTDLAIS